MRALDERNPSGPSFVRHLLSMSPVPPGTRCPRCC